MALSSGTLAASATPATDLMALINTALVAAGWTEETTRTYTQRLMGSQSGTTNRVYVSYSTTNGSGTPVAGSSGNITSGIYTGCILSFEIDDTNLRIRIRCTEKFDSSAVGATVGAATTAIATDLITKASHGLVANDMVIFENLASTTNISNFTPYWVVSTGLTTNDFKIALTQGGTAIDLQTSNGTVDVYKLANNTKWAAPGTSNTGSATPTANYAVFDSFMGHAQLGTNIYVGYVDINVGIVGFNYWLGANANRIIVMANAAGTPNVFIGGQVSYQGDLNTPTGNACVFIMSCFTSTSAGTGNWTYTSASAHAIVRVSRIPGVTNSSSDGPFSWTIAPACGFVGGAITVGNNPQPWGGPGQRAPIFYQASMIAFPAWFTMPNVTSGQVATDQGRQAAFILPEALVFMNIHDSQSSFDATTRAVHPNLGDTATSGGVTYTSTGAICSEVSVSNVGGLQPSISLWIDGSQF